MINVKKVKSDLLIERITDPEQRTIVGEIWKGKTQGDPVLEYHYYRVVRTYAMGKRTIVTDKMRPEFEEARKRVGTLAANKCLQLDGQAAA